MGDSPQLLGDQAYILIGLIVPGGDAGIAHQRANVGDTAVKLRVFLQPHNKLTNQMAPTDPKSLRA